MKRTSIRLCRYGAVVLIVLQTVAVAESLSISQLRDEIMENGPKSGWFIQCTKHGSANIMGSGRFTFEPEKRIELNFNHPNQYVVNFFNDGTQTKSVNGIEQKSPRHSPLGRLIFSIMSMKKSLLDNHFEINLAGNIDQFRMLLTPRKRMAKIIRVAEIAGTSGLVDTLRITTRDKRTIVIRLFPKKQLVGLVCE